MSEKAVRFTISDDNGLCAVSWKLWSPSGKNDVYLACRDLGGVFKTSLHASGKWHVAYDPATYEEIVKGAIVSHTSRFMQIWDRPPQISPGFTRAYQIVTPALAVTIGNRHDADNVHKIPNCAPGKATEVNVVILDPGTKVTGWPGKNGAGTQLLDSYALPNGETVWVVFRVIDMPSLQLPSSAKPQYYRGRTVNELNGADLRALAFLDSSDGSKVIVDAVVRVSANSASSTTEDDAKAIK